MSNGGTSLSSAGCIRWRDPALVPPASPPASSGGVSPPEPMAGARTPRNSQPGRLRLEFGHFLPGHGAAGQAAAVIPRLATVGGAVKADGDWVAGVRLPSRGQGAGSVRRPRASSCTSRVRAVRYLRRPAALRHRHCAARGTDNWPRDHSGGSCRSRRIWLWSASGRHRLGTRISFTPAIVADGTAKSSEKNVQTPAPALKCRVDGRGTEKSRQGRQKAWTAHGFFRP